MKQQRTTSRHPLRRLRAWTSAIVTGLTIAGSLLATTTPVVAAQLSDFGQPFHFLAPLGVESGDPAKFDPTLLDDLVVAICRIDGTSCIPEKTLTSASSLSERLRLGPTNGTPTYYLANWDTSKVKLAPSSFRVAVTVDRLQLGSLDVGPAQYKSFGRTWPIKFRIENNPTIRVRVLHEAGKSASQIASVLKTEFGLGPDDIRQLLANDLDPFGDQEIDVAINGVFQTVVLPPTTKIADSATQNALTGFDPTSGQMTFSASTATLGNLSVGDVLVGEPGANVPNGYLRKVTSITKSKKTGVITLQTTQARLDETVTDGTLDARGDLHPSDLLSAQPAPGVTLRETGAMKQAKTVATASLIGPSDVSDGFEFHESIDITLDGATAGDGVSGTGTVRIQGQVKFNAGYNVGMGVEGCLKPPFFTCVDRFEAHVGAHMYSDLHVTGTFDGELHKEYVLSTHYFQPIVFFIGPVPVVLVPVVKAIAGLDGNAHITFSFEAQATGDLDLGGKWTDPDDGGSGWADVSHFPDPTGTANADVLATMTLKAYAAGDAQLLLYGVAGPGLVGRLGLEGDAQFPGDPVWEIWGIAYGRLTFSVDLGGILSLAEYHADLPGARVHLASAVNQKPTCSGRTDPIPVAPNTPTYLGPRTDQSFGGYFVCADPEGGNAPATGYEGTTKINLSAASWPSGDHDVVVTATDDTGLTSDPFTLHITVIDTPPILSVTTAGGSVPASVQYFVTASAWDVEGGRQGDGGYLPCTAMTWEVTGGTASEAISNQTCTVSVVFTQTGFQTVKVTATEPGGKFSEQTVNVLVGASPANAAPVIDMDQFGVYAASGPKLGCYPGQFDCHESCPSGFFCMVPMDSILYNGTVGDYHPPLTLSLSATDPNGDPLTVHWFCQVGAYPYPVTDNGDGTFSCNPWSSSITTPIFIWATVSDGTTTVRTEVRRLYMLDRVA